MGRYTTYIHKFRHDLGNGSVVYARTNNAEITIDQLDKMRALHPDYTYESTRTCEVIVD